MNRDKKCHEKCEGINQCMINYINKQLVEAAKENKKEKVKELLSIGANSNFQDEDGYTAIMYASINGYLDLVYILFKKKKETGFKNWNSKLDINFQNKDGYTAIMYASINRHAHTMQKQS